jgi:hypothetical protein
MASSNKWNIGTINVPGQAMFGDHNVMNVDPRALHVPDPPAVSAAIQKLHETVQAPATPGQPSLSNSDKTGVQESVQQLVGELKKPEASQNGGLLRDCMDKVITVAGAVPAVVSAALDLKSLLGF